MLVHSSAMKSRKRFTHIVFDTFAKHSSLVHDSSATNGSTQHCVFATFNHWLFFCFCFLANWARYSVRKIYIKSMTKLFNSYSPQFPFKTFVVFPPGNPVHQHGNPVHQHGNPVHQHGNPVHQHGNPVEILSTNMEILCINILDCHAEKTPDPNNKSNVFTTFSLFPLFLCTITICLPPEQWYLCQHFTHWFVLYFFFFFFLFFSSFFFTFFFSLLFFQPFANFNHNQPIIFSHSLNMTAHTSNVFEKTDRYSPWTFCTFLKPCASWEFWSQLQVQATLYISLLLPTDKNHKNIPVVTDLFEKWKPIFLKSKKLHKRKEMLHKITLLFVQKQGLGGGMGGWERGLNKQVIGF